MKFKAHLHKIQVDKDGEAKIILTVPMAETKEIFQIPPSTVLDVEIKAE